MLDVKHSPSLNEKKKKRRHTHVIFSFNSKYLSRNQKEKDMANI